MIQEFVNYNQALSLKQLGFNEDCICYYWTEGMLSKTYNDPFNYNKKENTISTPLYQQAFRWFRNDKNYIPIIELDSDNKYTFSIYDKLNSIQLGVYGEQYNTYEEAESECLDKLIEIAKCNKQ